MNLNNLSWWLIILLNLASYFIFRFGIISQGNSKVVVEFVGGLLLTSSFIIMFIVFGLISALILVPIFWFIMTPAVEIILNKLSSKLYPSLKDKNKAELREKFIEALREIKKEQDKTI